MKLRSQLSVWGATLMGLGSIVGTGVFVTLAMATEMAGPAVIVAVFLASLVAICNGLSSAQLAACHPVSGGTYEYGYRYLNAWLGFLAGWMFLIAKSASAATAALGFSAYFLLLLGWPSFLLIPVAWSAVAVLTGLAWSGLQRTHQANSVMVFLTLLSLLVFVLAGLPHFSAAHLLPFWSNAAGQPLTIGAGLQATALIFVAYTGYGRIATLGEEVHHPRQTIPRAIFFTLLITLGIYLAIAVVGIGSVGAKAFSYQVHSTSLFQPAPLARVAQHFTLPFAAVMVSIGAMTAMLGVVLNLIVGLSRVLLAMGRRQDMPSAFARLNREQSAPTVAVIAVGIAITALLMVGDIKTTWSFSAFTVLIYYALTHLAALQIPIQERLYPRWVAGLGLLSCLGLAFWVESQVWISGLGLIALGVLWHLGARREQNKVS